MVEASEEVAHHAASSMNRGFTLIEAIITVCIVGTLLFVMFSILSKSSAGQQAKADMCNQFKHVRLDDISTKVPGSCIKYFQNKD